MRIQFRYSLLLCALALSGCGERVETYSVAKTPAEPSAVAPSQPVSWASPEGWEQLAADGMRLASYQVSTDAGVADISVIVLSGDGGGLVQNINRWRGQVGLSAGAPDEIEAAIETIPAGNASVTFVELRGPEGGDGILGGLLDSHGQTWFFKMKAPDALLLQQKETFRSWLQTIQVSHDAE